MGDRQPYRAPIPVEPDPYLAAWANVRRRQIVMWALLASLLPVTVTSLLLLQGRGFLVALAWTAPLSLAWAYAVGFRCPQCRRTFGKSDREDFAALVDHCMHCGIRIGTPKS